MNKNANTDELKIDEHIKDEALYDWADSYNYVIDYVYANKSIDSSVFLPDLYANSHLDNILSFDRDGETLDIAKESTKPLIVRITVKSKL